MVNSRVRHQLGPKPRTIKKIHQPEHIQTLQLKNCFLKEKSLNLKSNYQMRRQQSLMMHQDSNHPKRIWNAGSSS